ncbi:uncharacterized protein [Drosophila bipectinata]|uniref:uncharacterized protein n=1 Tax=Drosophila bipectinata TaxID=42026 RepID=UPI0038B2B541
MPIFFRAFSRSSIRPMVGNQQKSYLRWAYPKIRENTPPNSPVPVGIFEEDPTLYKRPLCRRLLGGAEKLKIKSCMAESSAGLHCERVPTWANIQKHIGTLEKTYNRNMRETPGQRNSNKDLEPLSEHIDIFYDQITERKKRPRSRRTPARATLNIPQTRHHLSFLLTRLASRRRSRSHRRSPKDPSIIPAPPPTIRKFLMQKPRRKRPVRFSKTEGIEESFQEPPQKTKQPKRKKKQVVRDDTILPEEEPFLPRQAMKKFRKKRIYQALRPPLKIPTSSAEDPRTVYRKAKRSRNKERELGSTDLGDGSEGVGSTIPTKLNKKQRNPDLLEENVDKEKEEPKKSSWLFESDATMSQNMGTNRSSVGIIRKMYTRRRGKSRQLSSDTVQGPPGQKLIRKAKPEGMNPVLSSQTSLKKRKLIRKRSRADASVLWGPKRSSFKLGEGLKIKDYGLRKVKKASPPKEEEDVKNGDARTTRRSFRTMDRASITSARSAASDMFGRLSKSFDASIGSKEDVETRHSWNSVEETTGDVVVPNNWDSPVDNDTFFEKIRRNLIMMANQNKPTLREDVSFSSKMSQDVALNMYAYPTRIDVQDATEANPKKSLKKGQKRKKRRRVPLVDADTQTKCVCEICHYLQKFKPEKLPPIYAEVAARQKNLKNRQYYMENLRYKNFTILDTDKPENPDDCRPITAPVGNIQPDYHSKHTDPLGDDVKCNGKNIYMKRSMSASYWSLSNAYANKSRILDDYKAPNVSKVFQRCYRTLFEADQQTTNLSATDCQYQEKLCCT